MTLLYLVRHGEPASGWGETDPDPGLSKLGLTQAAHAAGLLRERGLRRAITSPLKRCLETAAAFEMEVGSHARIVEGVREVPTPAAAGDRKAWLAGVMNGLWSQAPELTPFRQGVAAALIAQHDNVTVFTHFVAINAAVGVATGDDRVTIFKPAHASITVLKADGGKLTLVELGAETAAVNAI